MRPLALARLVLAELRGRRLRAMLLFAGVVALAAAALVAGIEGQTDASDRWDAAFAEANGAHVTVDGAADVIAEVAALPEVAASTRAYVRSAKPLEVVVGREPVTTAFVREMAGDDLPSIARPLLRDGRWVAADAADEIVIDRAFGIEEGVDVGDDVDISTAGGRQSFTVVGRAIDLIDCFYPGCDPVTVWVDRPGFARLGVATVGTSFLRLRDPAGDEQFVAQLGSYPVGTQGWTDTRDDTLSTYEIFGAFLGAFGVFVMVAAGVVVAGSMATRAVARRRDIGLLKAVGTTPRQIAGSIVLAHALGAAAGVVAGWVLGGFLAPATQVDLGETLGAGGAVFSVGTLLVALVVVEVIVVIATVVPAWRAGRVPTAAALASVHARPGRISGRWTGRLGLGPVGVAGIRDVFGRPARSVLTAIALALALVALMVSIGTQRTIDRVFGEPALVGNPEELRVYPLGSVAPIEAAMVGQADVESTFTEAMHDLSLDASPFLGVAMSGDVAKAGFKVEEGRMFAATGEAVAGWGLLDRFGLDVGDRVTVEANGQPIRLTIVGWYRESEDTGEILRFGLDDLRRVASESAPDWVSVNVAPDADPRVVAESLAGRLGTDQARVELQTTEGNDEIDAFRLAFLLVSALVVIVALANLTSTMVLSVRQRAHDLGVLRAAGVTPRQVVTVVAWGGAALALAAAVIGVPLGWIVSDAVTEVVGSVSGIGPGIGAGPGMVSVVMLVPLAIAVAALLGAAACRRVARAEVSDLVRYE
jgi:putative ABC transport system permease protein